MAQPDDAVVTKLAAAGLGLTSGTNVFAGRIRPQGSGVPFASVFCEATGGPVNQPYLGNAADWRVKTVQVRVRSDPRAFETGQTLARGCLTALHRAALTGYTWCYVREPHPTYLQQDESGCHHWTLNVELGVKE